MEVEWGAGVAVGRRRISLRLVRIFGFDRPLDVDEAGQERESKGRRSVKFAKNRSGRELLVFTEVCTVHHRCDTTAN